MTRVLIHIPARAGSKGVPGKNLRAIGGLSLVAWAARVGQAFLRAEAGDHGLRGEVLVDTDGADIAAEAAGVGCPVPFMRPAELAGDGALTIDATLAALDHYEQLGKTFDELVLLQPTSPLRALDDVRSCFEAHRETGSALTVGPPPHPPQRALRLDAHGVLHSLWPGEVGQLPRQQLEPAVEPNGAVYVCRVDFLRRHRAFFVPSLTHGVSMPAVRSVDIDRELDFAVCEAFMRARPRRTIDAFSKRACFVIAENTGHTLTASALDAAANAGADAVSFGALESPALVKSAHQRGIRLMTRAPSATGSADGAVVSARTRDLAWLAANEAPLALFDDGATPFELATALDVVAASRKSSQPAAILCSRLDTMGFMLTGFDIPVGFTSEVPGESGLVLAAVARGASVVNLPLSSELAATIGAIRLLERHA